MGRIWYPVIYVLSPKITNIISSESQARERSTQTRARTRTIIISESQARERGAASKRV